MPSTARAYNVRNPFDREQTATVRFAGEERTVDLEPSGEAAVTFTVTSAGPRRLAAELTVGETRFGQQAEALVE